MKFNEDELDALAEVFNIGVGRAANALSEITGSQINLSVPNIQICDTDKVNELFETDELSLDFMIQQGFEGKLSGQGILTFLNGDAVQLARIVGDLPAMDSEMDEETHGILEEIGNIVLNSILGSISNLFDCRFSYSLPKLCENQCTIKKVLSSSDVERSSESIIVLTDTMFSVADCNISGSLLVLFETGNIKELLTALATAKAV